MKTHRLYQLFLPVLLLLSAAIGAQNLNYYLDIPDIPGEVTAPGYEDQICVSSFSYGVSRDDGSGRTSATVDQLDFRVGKSFDVASPLLFGAGTRGIVLDRIVLTAVTTNPNDGRRERLAEYEMTDVIITSYQTGGSTAEESHEVIVLRPARIAITHVAGNGSETTTFYDFENGTGG